MADLDYLAEEFIKMKTAQEKQREKSLGSEVRKECACSQRVQQAELRLLTLQYSMCRQHCWTLYCTSAEGGQLTAQHEDMNHHRPKDAPVNFLSILQKLESDYNHMRNQILEGVPLEQLQPLSVDSEKITAGASYVPAQIVGEVLGGPPFWSSLNPQQCNTTGEENGDPNSGCQSQEKRGKREICKSSRAVTLIPHNSQLEEKQIQAACKELKTNEAWYDAEEELQPAGSSAAAETTQDLTKEGSKESSCEETESSLLCVSNLPGDVTESDLMLWFEKHSLSGVHICNLKKDSRVAIVMVSGAQSAEAAVRGLNGCSLEGHALHVEHINGAVDGSQSRASQEASQDATKPPPSNTEKESTLSSSINQRKEVSVSPAAKTTWVPQHFGTMGSFDSLTEELMRLHPAVGRQRIMEALVELRATHQGLLRSLPLGVIREMTSQLLSRPAGATQP
ncbi:RNA-binding protein 44 [Echeneis naucrates]|uniref:RNA-binding protein 44 n=1 Tax=Echeneis naucrates TaxID=173247 RepID=UPI0011145D51|nr:RNA-binding protein 44 [Echeneis naucrates]